MKTGLSWRPLSIIRTVGEGTQGTKGSPRLLGSRDDLYLRESFRRDPDGQPEDGWWGRLGIEMWRVFFLQLLPSPWLEEDRHGIVSSAQLNDLLGNFVADPHLYIVVVTFS